MEKTVKLPVGNIKVEQTADNAVCVTLIATDDTPERVNVKVVNGNRNMDYADLLWAK